MAELSTFAQNKNKKTRLLFWRSCHGRTFMSVGETRKHLQSEAISGMEVPTLLNTRVGAHGHVISHICITDFLLKTSPNVTLMWAEAPKAPDLSESNYVCGMVPMGELSGQQCVEMNCRLDLKGLLFLITTRRNFWPFLLRSLKLFDSRFKLYTFFFLGLQISSESRRDFQVCF